MRLNPGTSESKPSVSKTSTPAIIAVMVEVCVFTLLLGLAMHALPGLHTHNGEVDAPGHPGVRDYMLRYMAEVFVGNTFGAAAATVAIWSVSLVFGLLLLSAVNTAIVDLISISYLMARDGELPRTCQKLNRFGVPLAGMIVATIVPLALVLAVSDMVHLADLYAIGVVGAIATNLGATATDCGLGLLRKERVLMFVTFLIMAAIEISLLVDKPHARAFAVTVLAIGLILRGLATERAAKKRPETPAMETEFKAAATSHEPLLCAVRGIGKTIDFAIEEARETGRALYVLFVREQAVITEEDRERRWEQDPEATEIFEYARRKAPDMQVLPCYVVSDSAADTIIETAASIGASRLILGSPQRSGLLHLLRGNIIREVSRLLPDNIHLLVYA
jgi:nucleotide-binding universal stress UspA family protein